MFGLKLLRNMTNFHPLDGVGRVGETQFQVGEDVKNEYIPL